MKKKRATKTVQAPAKKKPAAAKKRAAAPKKTAAPKKKAAPKRTAARKKAPAKRKAAAKNAAPGKARTPGASRKRSTSAPPTWVRFVEKHGVVLASAKGPVPSVAEAIAGEPIVGSWWSHPRAQAIFDALSAIDDDVDVRCFKLVDSKVTFVHRRLWPALVRLAREGRISADRAASIQQEHLPTGDHRNLVMPFPDWVPDEVAAAAEQLSADEARQQLGAWT